MADVGDHTVKDSDESGARRSLCGLSLSHDTTGHGFEMSAGIMPGSNSRRGDHQRPACGGAAKANGSNGLLFKSAVTKRSQRQAAVTAYLKSKQLLLFVFVWRCAGGALWRLNRSQIVTGPRTRYRACSPSASIERVHSGRSAGRRGRK